MATKVIFDNTELPDSEATFEMIQEELKNKVAFSGSIEGGNTIFLFKNVNKDKFVYYINDFNNLKNNNKEVKFVIQTHDELSEKLQ